MPNARIDEHGHIILPPGTLGRFGLEPGAELALDLDKDGLALYPLGPDARRAFVEVTAFCNLDCAVCIRHSWRDQPGDMTWETFQKVIDDLRAFPRLERLTFGGLGEPLSHPRIADMLMLASSLNVGLVVTTNALLLDEAMARLLLEAHVDTVVVSLDSFHVQAYEDAQLHRGVDQVLDNIRRLRRLSQERGWLTPRIGLEFVATRDNQDQAARLPDIARDLGASFIMISNLLPYRPEQTGQTLYDRAEPVSIPASWAVGGGSWLLWGITKLPRMKWGAQRRCRFVDEESLVIGWDGVVSPCYALAHTYPYYTYGRRKEVERYALGDVRDKSLSEIWSGEEYVRFRAKVRHFRFPSCVDCALEGGCDFAAHNQDCWGNDPSCADCLWAQSIIQCP
ncbi:MAG: tungsten cofactor oxidoreductase radical SAM maturase [Chloroflexota bacterium]|nr:tungsten cofactor oxidoreductase radical SAM maturase [Chloroflexota bacterium]